MGAIEDVRKVIQDLVAPELKSLHAQVKNVDDSSKLRDEALSAKIDSIDTASKLRDEALSAKIDSIDAASKLRDEALSAKIDNLSDKMDRKFELVMAEMKANQAMLIYTLNIDKRVEAIERKTAEPMHAT